MLKNGFDLAKRLWLDDYGLLRQGTQVNDPRSSRLMEAASPEHGLLEPR